MDAAAIMDTSFSCQSSTSTVAIAKSLPSSDRKESAEAPNHGYVPDANLFRRIGDLTHLCITRVRIDLGGTREHPTPKSTRPLSEKGLFAHRYVEPLFTWWGHNSRVLASQSAGVVQVLNSDGTSTALVNGASHNYAGFYKMDDRSRALHQEALQSLPFLQHLFTNDPLREAMHKAIAQHFSADFCLSVSSGYGSNYLTIPAITKGLNVGLFVDSQCHNSIFTGCYLSSSQTMHKFRHNDTKHLESLLREKAWAYERIFIFIEGLYSMEGDTPPLSALYKLKLAYGFEIYCDEAHSFLTLGKTGRGCLELWNDTHESNQLPWDLIDLRSATLSKSTGGIGGIIVGKLRHREAIAQHLSHQSLQEATSLLTATALQTTLILGQSERIAKNLAHLASIAKFCRRELRSAGVYLYGDHNTPILPIWAGGPSMSARLSFELRKAGVLASPVSAPAVPFWQSRVRINLSADYCPRDVDRLLEAIVLAVRRCGIPGPSKTCTLRPYPAENVQKAIDNVSQEFIEARLRHLIEESKKLHRSNDSVVLPSNMLQPVLHSQSRYGVGSGSARWISGTYEAHLALETRIAEITGSSTAMTYVDSSLGLASTVAALARPLKGFKRHNILLPQQIDQFTTDGLTLANLFRRGQPNSTYSYHGITDLITSMRHCLGRCRGSGRPCFTVLLDLQNCDTYNNDREKSSTGITMTRINSALREIDQLAGKMSTKVTVLVCLSSSLQALAQAKLLERASFHNTHVLVYGSFYQLLGMPGGFLGGPRQLISELKYASRFFMFTTSAPPFVAEMALGGLATVDGKTADGNYGNAKEAREAAQPWEFKLGLHQVTERDVVA